MECGASFDEAFRYGLAAGAANAARWEVAAASADEVAALVPEVRCESKRPIAR
jgi:fructose-1-phosphate kinase PfkB-like protein